MLSKINLSRQLGCEVDDSMDPVLKIKIRKVKQFYNPLVHSNPIKTFDFVAWGIFI